MKARGREIDRHGRHIQAPAAPFAQLAAGLAQRPGAQLADQAAFLGQRDEACGRDIAELGMVPARQGLDAVQAAVLEVELGLVVQVQAAAAQRIAQCGLQHQALLRQLVHLGAEEAVEPAPARLGLVHGHVGAVQQGLHVAPVGGKHGNAAAGRAGQGHVVDHAGLAQGRLQPLYHLGRLRATAVRQHDDEFIARQAPGNVARAQLRLDALGHAAQQPVAGRVAQRIVDLLETVQVDEDHGQLGALLRCRRQRLLGLGQQQAAVGQGGQPVVEGQLADAAARLLALQRQGAQVGTGLHQPLVERIGAGPVEMAVVEGKGAGHPALQGADGGGPAGRIAQRQDELLEVGPQRVGGNVAHQHGPVVEGGRAAGADIGADGHAVQRRRVRGRQAGRGQRVQAVLLVHLQHRHRNVGRNALHLAADQVQHLGQRLVAGHGLQGAPLQHLVHLGLGDVGDHGHRGVQPAIGAHDGIGLGADPIPLAVLADEDLLAVHRLACVQFGAVGSREFGRSMGHQQGDGRTAHDLFAAPAEHAGEACVDIGDGPVAVGDHHGRVGGIGHQGQAPQMFLPSAVGLHPGRDVGGNAQHMAERALGIQHGGIGGLQPAGAAVAAPVFAHARNRLAPAPALAPPAVGVGIGMCLCAQVTVQQALGARGRVAKNGFVIGVGAHQPAFGRELRQRHGLVQRAPQRLLPCRACYPRFEHGSLS